MADGVPITAGSGTTVLTDDTGAGGHAQVVKLAISADADGTPIPADAANGLDVDVTRLPALASGTNNIGDVDVLTVPAPLSTTGGGTEAAALRVTVANNSTGLLPVSGTVTANAGTGPFPVSDNGGSLTVDAAVSTPVFVRLSDGTTAIATLPVSLATVPSHAVTNAGTFAVQSTLGAGTTYAGKVRLTDGTNDASVSSSGALFVGGSLAHDAVDGGQPLKVGGRASNSVSTATMVAHGDRTDAMFDLDGIQMVKFGCSIAGIVRFHAGLTATTSTAVTGLGATASTRNVITSMTIHNSSAVDTFVELQDGNGGTTFAVFPAPAKGGSVQSFAVPLPQPTVNTALHVKINAAASTVYVTMVGYRTKAG